METRIRLYTSSTEDSSVGRWMEKGKNKDNYRKRDIFLLEITVRMM